MAKDLAQIAKTKKIKYFLISFVDLFGVLRAKLVPARAIAGMQKDGAGFAGFAPRRSWHEICPYSGCAGGGVRAATPCQARFTFSFWGIGWRLRVQACGLTTTSCVLYRARTPGHVSAQSP